MRAAGVIGQIEGGAEVGPASADVGFGPAEVGFGIDGTEHHAGGTVTSAFGPGSVGRREAIIWGAAGVWLFLVWRAVKGY